MNKKQLKRSTNNAFTGATNNIDWTSLERHVGSVRGGEAASRKSGTPVYLPNSAQQRAYSKAGGGK